MKKTANLFRALTLYLSGIMLFLLVSNVSAADLIVKSNKIASLNGKIYRCAVGRNGMTSNKVEGDLKTPVGKFPLRCVYYRSDKFPCGIETGLPKKILYPNLGWCDDSASPNYNRPVELPFPGSYESLWRGDELYDLIVVVGYNDQPVCKGKGSAIFIHIAPANYSKTPGCIVFSRQDLLEILKKLDKKSSVTILPP